MKHNSDFKFDLHRGQIGENYLANILKGEIEVKTDFLALKTGNIYIEYESRGKKSGISTTQSEWYAFVLSNIIVILIKTKELKNICKTKGEIKLGGDNNTSKGVVLPIKELYDKQVKCN
mgnify:CR=1 FL=1